MHNSDKNQPKLLKEDEAAQYMALSIKTLQSWRCRGGRPPFVKLGGAVRYRLSDLDAFVAASARRSTSERSGGDQ